MGINKDQVEGKARELGGKIQEDIGKMMGNKAQEAKGKVNQAVGAGQAKAGDVAEMVKDATRKRP